MLFDNPLLSKRFLLRAILVLFLTGVAAQFIRGIPIRTIALADDATRVFGKNLTSVTGFSYIGINLIADLFFVSSFLLTAIMIFRNKPDSLLVTFFALMLVSIAVSESDVLKRLQIGYVNGKIIFWDNLSFLPAFFKAFALASTQIFFFMFPNGRFAPAWTKPAAIVWAFISLMCLFFPFIPFNPVYGFTWDRTPLASLLVYLFSVSIGMYVQIYRWRYVYTPTEKLQVKWVLWGATLMFVVGATLRYTRPPSSLLPEINTLTRVIATVPAIALTYSFSRSVQQYKLLELNPVLSQTLVWLIMTAIVVIVFVIIVSGFSIIFPLQSAIPTAIATGLVAILFQPLRLRIQKQINRRIFGMRDDPWVIMNKLYEQQKAAGLPNVLLNQITETIAQMLKLPYIVIEVGDAENARVLTQYGSPQSDPLPFEMVYQSKVVGRLIVVPRAAGETFNKQDVQLLNSIAQQVATAVQLVIVNSDLQHSRENLVTAREEERRRLQRDLHDGLGPKLAAHTINIGTARSQLFTNPDEADILLERVETEIAHAVTEIRHLIYALRPPALDQLGLVHAIEEFAATNRSSMLNITVDAPTKFVRLPAALEVAIYRIVQESVTNVVRHANAHTCTIKLAIDDEISLEILDDGQGLPEPNRKVGIGLTSIRERAEELGGRCLITSHIGAGTSILIYLPVLSKHDVPSKNNLDI